MSNDENKNDELEREFELERMVLFTDAVFAIAITLLVIDIKWPEMPERLRGVDLGKLFGPTILQFCAFGLSFFFIGRSWVLHLKLFRLLRRYDQHLINLNLLFLFFIITFPFTASGIAGHVRNDFPFPLYLYIGNIAVVTFLHYLITRYIFQVKHTLSVPGEGDVKKYILIRSKYNAIGIGTLFLALLIVALLRKSEAYFQYILPAFSVYIFLFNRSTRKFRPKRAKAHVFETGRTYFTVLTEDDLPAMAAMARERDTFRYIKKLRVMDEEEYQAFLRKKLEQIRLKTGYHWAVWLKKNDKFIGAVNLNPIAGSGRLQVGCQLRRRYWGQGYASELTRRVLEFAIGEAGLTEVYGVFEKDNVASRRLMEKLGFSLLETKTELDVDLEIHKYVIGPGPLGRAVGG